MENQTHTVVLENGTVGTIAADTIDYQDIDGFIGEIMTVKLHDENGNLIEQSGRLVEVL